MYSQRTIINIITLWLTHSALGKVMRNNALMTKMMTDFQKDKSFVASEMTAAETNQTDRVFKKMQHVLCRNFPEIPCTFIMADEKLNKLIEKSIHQINLKSMSMTNKLYSYLSTSRPGLDLGMFPGEFGEKDLNKYLNARKSAPFNEPDKSKRKKIESKSRMKKRKEKTRISHKKASVEMSKHSRKRSRTDRKTVKKRPPVYDAGRKKMRKFYPHKIKYKDKGTRKEGRKEVAEYSEEKLSMSVEAEDAPTRYKNFHRMAYTAESEDTPVWRIDYMKHGEPSINNMRYESERQLGKIIKTGPNVIVDDSVLEQVARKDVLHPDVYINKSFRKNSVDFKPEGEE